MLGYLTRTGSRKLILGLAYLGCCTGLSAFAIAQSAQINLNSMAGLASLNVSMATGLGAVIWGNREEHRAKAANGGGE